LDAWNKKNFSPQEKIAEKGKREGMGISWDIYDMIHDSFIQSRLPLFQRYAIW
jgi:hypothetical protein